MYVLGILLLLIGGLFLLGWIVPLVMGVRRANRSQGGIVLLVVGGLWGLLAIGVGSVGVLVAYKANQSYKRSAADAFDANSYEGETGQLVLSLPGEPAFWVTEQEGGRNWRIESTDNVLVVPAVPLKVTRIVWSMREDNGTFWTLTTTSLVKDWRSVEVAAAERKEFPVGHNLKASVKVRNQGNQMIGIDLVVKDDLGNSFSLTERRDGARPMSFEATDESGAVVWRGNFAYG